MMAKKPNIMPPVLQAASLLAHDLLPDVERHVKRRPILADDLLAQSIGVADLALSLLLSDPRFRQPLFIDNLAEYVRVQGRAMLASITRHGIDNPPHPPGDFGQGEEP